jgi:RNA polymerase sigma-70 factor (ECF subfamily)
MDSIAAHLADPARLYEEAAAEYCTALSRLARAYENDPEKRRDLLQEIHLALWRSMAGFDGRCSLRTWVYRVAHNAAASYVLRQKRARAELLVGIEEIEAIAAAPDSEQETDRRNVLARLTVLIQSLKPLDRQVILSYFEGLSAADIGEITGLSARNVATKIHRIKHVLAREFHSGGSHAE